MKKRTLVLLLFSQFVFSGYSQKNKKVICPDAILGDQKKVMLMEFAENYSTCPVILENVVYYKFGYPTFFEKPRIFKEKKIFQIYPAGGEINSTPLDNSLKYGDFVVINDNSIAENIFETYQEGDKLKIEGKTFVFSQWGVKYHVFFIADKITRIN